MPKRYSPLSILIELPDFPAELKNTGIGHHKGELAPCGGRLVGRLNKALFFRAQICFVIGYTISSYYNSKLSRLLNRAVTYPIN